MNSVHGKVRTTHSSALWMLYDKNQQFGETLSGNLIWMRRKPLCSVFQLSFSPWNGANSLWKYWSLTPAKVFHLWFSKWCMFQSHSVMEVICLMSFDLFASSLHLIIKHLNGKVLMYKYCTANGIRRLPYVGMQKLRWGESFRMTEVLYYPSENAFCCYKCPVCRGINCCHVSQRRAVVEPRTDVMECSSPVPARLFVSIRHQGHDWKWWDIAKSFIKLFQMRNGGSLFQDLAIPLCVLEFFTWWEEHQCYSDCLYTHWQGQWTHMLCRLICCAAPLLLWHTFLFLVVLSPSEPDAVMEQ